MEERSPLLTKEKWLTRTEVHEKIGLAIEKIDEDSKNGRMEEGVHFKIVDCNKIYNEKEVRKEYPILKTSTSFIKKYLTTDNKYSIKYIRYLIKRLLYCKYLKVGYQLVKKDKNSRLMLLEKECYEIFKPVVDILNNGFVPYSVFKFYTKNQHINILKYKQSLHNMLLGSNLNKEKLKDLNLIADLYIHISEEKRETMTNFFKCEELYKYLVCYGLIAFKKNNHTLPKYRPESILKKVLFKLTNTNTIINFRKCHDKIMGNLDEMVKNVEREYIIEQYKLLGKV